MTPTLLESVFQEGPEESSKDTSDPHHSQIVQKDTMVPKAAESLSKASAQFLAMIITRGTEAISVLKPGQKGR